MAKSKTTTQSMSAAAGPQAPADTTTQPQFSNTLNKLMKQLEGVKAEIKWRTAVEQTMPQLDGIIYHATNVTRLEEELADLREKVADAGGQEPEELAEEQAEAQTEQAWEKAQQGT